MFMFSYVWMRPMLDLWRMILLMFFGIWKTRVKYQPAVIKARAHLSQLVLLFGVYTFGMSIDGIRHVDSWGAAPPISIYEIRVSEH